MQENTHARGLGIALLAAGSTFVLDQWLKSTLFANESLLNGSWLLGLIRFTDHHNYGISFNLPVPLWLIIAIAIGALIWAFREVIRPNVTRYALRDIFLGIFIGGVLGNLFDRITLGFVRDWLLLWGRSAVNLADGAILLGLIGYLFHSNKPAPPTLSP
ncbi:signal peptidase II [Candidatus Uhrbacteria bacterium]|nr:signal peptidase II [Candidatus Uhrbacteria bacterium]